MSDDRINGEPAAIDVARVSLTYPARRRQPARLALHHLSFAVPAGAFVALLGPNGSGKSTLMKVICGSLAPGAGTVAVFGESRPREFRRRLGVVFQSESLDPHLTVFENLRDQARLYGVPSAEARMRIGSMLEEADLGDRRDALVKTLSRGLARRVDLIRALLHGPRLLLLDEPTVGLDPAAREAFLRTIERRREADGLTILMSTHLVDEADRTGRVILMHDGAIVADDAPASLRSALGARLLTIHDAAWTPGSESEGAAASPWRHRAGAWVLPLPDDADEAVRLATHLMRLGVPYSIAPPTLADVFEGRTGEALAESERDAPGTAGGLW